jgi:hypothetical protein
MKFVITISCDNSAFNRKASGCALALILQIVTDRVELESKSDLIRGYHDDPKSLFDCNSSKPNECSGKRSFKRFVGSVMNRANSLPTNASAYNDEAVGRRSFANLGPLSSTGATD